VARTRWHVAVDPAVHGGWLRPVSRLRRIPPHETRCAGSLLLPALLRRIVTQESCLFSAGRAAPDDRVRRVRARLLRTQRRAEDAWSSVPVLARGVHDGSPLSDLSLDRCAARRG